ncbi:MAG: DUF2206 domain-containing protein [Nitrososphaeria archaeon]
MVILLFQVLTDILIIFNVSIARQILVFIYLTFIPGLIILKLLKVKELDELETFFLSLGLSISFLMFTGLIVNEAYLLLNLSSPLSPAPMLVAFNIFSICGALIIIRRNNDRELINVKNFRQIIFSVFLSSLPILSIIGAMWVNIFRDNAFLLLLIVAIAAVFILGLISRRFQSLNLYTLSILMIGLSLLYHTSLISNYIIALGSDVPVEYSVFKITETNAKWSHIFLLPEHLGYGRLNSMLSVTILPTIYSKLLNAGPTWIYKILYPTLFSFVPLILFKLWQRNFGSKKAFVAIFLLMAQNTFYTEIAVLNRQMIGELFFALILFIIVKNGLKKFQKMLFFVIFSFALIVSHYAIAEILLFFLTLVLICLFLIKRSAGNITLTMVVLFSVMMFVWYIFTSNSTVFKSIVNYGNYVYSQLSDFLSLESRGETVLRGLGLEQPPTVWNLFSRMFAYTTEFFIAIGFIGLTTRRIKYNFSKEEYSLTLSAIFFLSALILVPGLANTMNMSRFYHLLLFFLAPIFVLGAEFIIKLTFKHQSEIKLSILVLTILIPYFLFQTGFIYEIVKNQSWSLPLSGYRMDPIFLKWATRYFAESEVIGAIWLSKYVARNNSMTYADAISTSSLLNGYGMMIYGLNMGRLSNATNFIHDSYIYLNSLNAVNNIVITDMYLLNTSDIKIFDFSSKVYSNGNCDIYQVAK